MNEQLQKFTKDNEKLVTTTSNTEAVDYNKEIKEYKDKIAVAESITNKFQKKVEESENEAKKYLLLLKRELGQSANMENILKDDPGWKAREDTITKLKSKNSELQNKIMALTQKSDSEQPSTTSTSSKYINDKKIDKIDIK